MRRDMNRLSSSSGTAQGQNSTYVLILEKTNYQELY